MDWNTVHRRLVDMGKYKENSTPHSPLIYWNYQHCRNDHGYGGGGGGGGHHYQPPAHDTYADVHSYGGGHSHSQPRHKSKGNSSAMSALTLLAFLFFLNILQSCLKEHMMAMNPTVSYIRSWLRCSSYCGRGWSNGTNFVWFMNWPMRTVVHFQTFFNIRVCIFTTSRQWLIFPFSSSEHQFI